MVLYGISVGILAASIFVFLSPRHKALLAFVVMTSCFDLAPRHVLNKDIWDLGAIMLFITFLHLLFVKTERRQRTTSYLLPLQIFIGWMFVCLLWSVGFYEYPLLDTLKASRQMILGYLSFFVFKKLFESDPVAYPFMMKSLFVTSFIVLPIGLIQYIIQTPLLFGLQREYGEVTRWLPIFLPIALLNFWIIVSKLLTADKVKIHEWFYLGMVMIVIALTYTRGIYLSVLLVLGVMIVTLQLHNKLSAGAVGGAVLLGIFCITVLLSGGFLKRTVERFSSGIDIILSPNSGKNNKLDADTFSGRLALAKERLELVTAYNPVVGYGFIHENNVPRALRAQLKHGSIITTDEYVEKYRNGHPFVISLYSSDIGWADVIIKTGLVGLALLLIFLLAFNVSYYRTTKFRDDDYYHAQLGFFLQMLFGTVLMFESNTFVDNVHITSFMIAGAWYCTNSRSHGQMSDVEVVGSDLVSVRA